VADTGGLGRMDGRIGGMDEWDEEDGLMDVRVREAQERGQGCAQAGGHTEQARYKAMRRLVSYKQCKVAAVTSTTPPK
jgi:hypothetical protein